MLHKTEGIVLGTSQYNDRYSLTHIFTREFGRVTYILPLSKSKKAKIKSSLFFPLSLLNLEVEHMPLREIQRLKDAERLIPLYEVCTDMVKVSLSFFLSEFLNKVLREADDNVLLFDFLKNSVEALEINEKSSANFHIACMIGLTRFLGIYPNWDINEENCFFDLLKGEFKLMQPAHSYYLNKEQSVYLKYLSRMNYSNMHLFKFSRSDRNLIIDYLLVFYRLHIYDFPKIKSLDVLRELV